VSSEENSLAKTVHSLRIRINSLTDRGESIGEQDTKAVLIDPLLLALGWELRDLDEVRREYRHKAQDNPVDYALLMLGQPRLFVEAKGLGSDLSEHRWISQILSYATVAGVEWCVLTDGDEYRLYNALAPVDVDGKLFRRVRISEDAHEDFKLATLRLLSKKEMEDKLIDVLWKAHFVDRHVKGAIEELFGGDDERLVRLLRRATKLPPSSIRESLKRADVRVEFPLVGATTVRARRRRKRAPRQPGTLSVQVSDLIRAGLINPPLELEKLYKGVRLTATVQPDGKIVFEGRPYDSLSTAAGMARKSIIGAPPGRHYPQTNGWTFWKFRDPETGKLVEIDALRQQYRRLCDPPH